MTTMATKLLVSAFLCLLVSVAVANQQQQQSEAHLREARNCRLQQLTTSQPSQVIQSEAGTTEFWNQNEDQFLCAGVSAHRRTLQPNSLLVPTYNPAPILIYIQQGRGLLGVNIPGCAQTFTSEGSQEEQQQQQQPGQQGSQEQQQQQQQPGQQGSQEQQPQQQQQEGRQEDYHQKVYRIRQGDVIAIPAGVSHWSLNDGQEQLVAVVVSDLNNQANQLDQSFRQFFLAGGLSSQGQQGLQNVLSGFDENLLADAFNVPVETVRNMQQDQRGFIVNVREGFSMIRPDEEEEQQQQGQQPNGLEETICTLRMKRNIDNRRDVEVYSRQAGRVNVANAQNLPVLRLVDMSAEKGNLKPNALYAPHWSSNGHSILYVISGDAQVQVVDDNGQTVLDQTVNQGDMFVIPQHYASTARAGSNGFEYVSIKTTSQPMQHPLVGQNSVLRAMPLQVLTNAYGISLNEAQNLKQSRRHQTFLLSPTRSSSTIRKFLVV